MSKLYLFNYNNYFNRIIKRGVTLSDYGTPIYSLSNTNFDENDGVTATHVVNYNAYDGDYIVITDDNNNIKSRWFVVENRKQRGGQHTLNLRRDLIVDYYNQIINAPALINRAMINDENNPLLFNNEGFSFNQIKKNEILLKDETLTAWYILYFPLNVEYPSGQTDFTGSFDISDIEYDETSATAVTSDNSSWKSGTYYYVSDYKYFINYDPIYVGAGETIPQPGCYVKQMNVPEAILTSNVFKANTTSEDFIWFDEDYQTVANKLARVFTESVCDNTLKPLTDAQYLSGKTLKDLSWFNEVNKYNNKTFILKTNVNGVINYYKVSVQVEQTIVKNYIAENTTLFDKMVELIDNANIEYTGSIDDLAFEYYYIQRKVTINTQPYTTSGTINWSLGLSTKVTPTDAPYQIIAIPYNTLDVQQADSSNCISYKKSNQMLVNSIIKECGTTNLVDVQLLPYFPYIERTSGKFSYDSTIEGTTFNNFEQNGDTFTAILGNKQYKRDYATGSTTVGVNIFYLDKANFTFNITKNISIPNRTGSPALNKKMSNELDVCRLCSPNYNGLFEFSIAKNNGVSYFNIDVTLRPFNPYIHINPDFKGLYGMDFNDSRGLICNGDFSLPIVTDLWKQYEYQNKNYQQVFNRQIEHMDFEFSKARTEALFGATVGTIGATVSGGVTGGLIGGGVGAGIGSLVGGISSAIGGAIDYNILKQRQAEAKDLAIDNFSYQLGNIKALPYSVNKITCLTFNNKLWPFIEEYSATDEEANILNNKILYNSMRVNAIGSISEYLQDTRTFISASLIRLEELNVPTHEANEIYDEIMKGVYI